jgi:hypothetical protein
MRYAHIYKTRAGYELIITAGAELNIGIVNHTVHPDKRAAKAAAKAANATPWNY